MSDYFETLDTGGKERYKEKLGALGLSISDDPYLPSHDPKFSSDMSQWPKIEYGHIFAYFISRPGTYTQEQLLSWKQLEAFNYFENGYVRTVLSMKLERGNGRCVLLKAKVNPSQKGPDHAHEAWMIARKDGEIVCAHCTCMAGLGEGCSHVAAIMFKIECAVRLGYTSSTSQECRWNETFCQKVEPSAIVNIQFQRPKRGRDVGETSTRVVKVPKFMPHTDESERRFLTELEGIQPSAVYFSSHAPMPSKTTCTSGSPVIRKLPPTLTSLQKPMYAAMTKEEVNAACKDVFTSGIAVTREEAIYLEESTRLQSQSVLWFEHRTCRITASKFLAVKRASIDPPPASLVKQVMERSMTLSHIPALRWGRDHEDTAREAYMELACEKHVNFQYTAAGLHVNPSYPHLGATPDGVINCDCCGEGVIEIKCPYKHRDKHPHDVTDPQFYLKPHEDGRMYLCRNHEYFYQIQGQLAVCEKEYCDFVCWTPHGVHVERILADPLHFSDTKAALDIFFLQVLLPLLLTGRKQVNSSRSERMDEVTQPGKHTIPNKHKSYCWCDGEDIGRMVACDNASCPKEWFHFDCVGLTRKPRGKWYCSDTCKGLSRTHD